MLYLADDEVAVFAVLIVVELATVVIDNILHLRELFYFGSLREAEVSILAVAITEHIRQKLHVVIVNFVVPEKLEF